MASIEDKFRSLVEGLYLGTSSGEIKWSSFPENDSFTTDVLKTKIEISSSTNGHGEALIIINVFDGSGNRVDTFTDEYFGRKAVPIHVSASSYFNLMSNLYEIARRNATGADLILDNLLSAIKAPIIDSDDDDISF